MSINYLINDRIPAHIVLDPYISESGLEGACFDKMLMHVASLQNVVGKELIVQCGLWQKMLANNKLSGVHREITVAIARDQKVLIPGGWKGDPYGHAMLYMLTKKYNGEYDLCVINTGHGLQYHQAIETSAKKRFLLGVYYKSIPEQELFYDADTSVFSDLLQLKVKQQADDFNPKEIYHGILAHLTPYQNNSPLIENNNDMLFITQQKGGTCAFRVIKAFIRLQLYLNGKKKADYKQYFRTIEFSTIENYLSSGSVNPELLKSMQLKVAKKVHKQASGITEKESEILLAAQEHAKKPSPVLTSTTPSSYKQLAKFKGQGVPIYRVKNHKPNRRTPTITGLTPRDILAEINSCEEKQSVCHYRPYILHKIDCFAQSLSLKRGDTHNRGFLFVDIFNLLQKYCNCSFLATGNATSRHLLTTYTLYFALWDLFPTTFTQIQKDRCERRKTEVEQLLNKLIPPQDLFQNLDKDLFFMITNPREQKHFVNLRKAFSTWESPENSYQVFDGKFFLLDKPLCINSRVPEFQFYRAYRQLLRTQDTQVFPYSLGGKSSKNLETEALLATNDACWDSFKPFAELRRAHYLVAALAHNTVSSKAYYVAYSHDEEAIAIRKRVDEQPFFQRSYGGYRQDLPKLIKEFFTLETSQKQQECLPSFSKATQKQADPLEKMLLKLTREDAAFLRELASITSAQPLVAIKLLSFYSQHASRLQNADERILFITQLFKTFKEGQNSAQLGLSEDALATAAHHFAETLQKLARDLGETPDHELFLFSSYILATISQYYNPIPEKLVKSLNQQKVRMDQQLECLRLAKGTETQQRFYHLHLLYYLTICNTKETFIEALSHYFAVCTLPPDRNQPDLFLEYAATSQIHGQLPFLAELNPEELQNLTTNILDATDIGWIVGKDWGSADITYDKKYGIIKVSKGKVLLHCATGDIFHQDQLIKRCGDFRDNTAEEYCLLFGNETFPTFSVEGTLYLQHPAGTFRKINNQITFQFQSQGSWAVFVPVKHMSKKIPLPFRAGYTHFYCLDKKRFIFIERDNYHLFDKAHFLELNNLRQITAYDHLHTFSAVECPALEAFDKQECIYEKTLSDGSRFIEVPRYNLTFKVNGNRLYWQQRPSFFVVNNNLPLGVLAIQKQSLLLENSSGEHLLLVPRFTTKAECGFSHNAVLQVPTDEEINWSDPLQQESYSCYTLSSDKANDKVELTSLTLDGTLDLAYYRIHERKYCESIKILKTVSPFDLSRLKSENISILEKIISYGARQKNQAPEVSTCILRAGLLLHDAEKANDPTYEFPYLIFRKLLATCRDYLSKKGHVAIDHWLTKEEVTIYQGLFPSVFEKYLQRFDYPISASVADRPILDSRVDFSEKMLTWIAPWKYKSPKKASKRPKKESIPDELQQERHFWSFYQAIRRKQYPPKKIESYLNRQRVKGYNNDKWIDLGLLCVKAREQGKSLPEGSDSFKLYKQGGYSDLVSTLSGISYRLLSVAPEKIPQTVLDTFKEEKFERIPGKYYVPDLKPFFSEPLFKQLNLKNPNAFQEEGLQKEEDTESLQIETGQDSRLYYKNSIERELGVVNREIFEGEKRLSKNHQLASAGQNWFENSQNLQASLKANIECLTRSVQEKKTGVLGKLHLENPEIPLTKDQLKQMAGITSPLSIEDVEYIALWGAQDPDFLRIACIRCPQFKDKKFQQDIWEQLFAYEVDTVQLVLYKKALSAYEKMEDATQRKAESEKKIYSAELALALEANVEDLTKGSPLSPLHMLIFSQRAQIFPRKDQLADINKLVSKDSYVLQKIMGGGKTSVIAAIWAFREASYTKKLPVIFAEGSLFQSLGDNIKKSQRTVFGQHIFTIDPPRANLDLAMIRHIYTQLKKGYQKRWVLVMKAETLQAFDLELQKLVLKGDPEDLHKRNALRDILNLFRNYVHALGDEIDLILRSDFEVNVPKGDKIPLSPSRIALVGEIFKALFTIKEFGMKTGAHASLKKESFEATCHKLAQHISASKLLCIPEEQVLQRVFIEFVMGNVDAAIPKALQSYVETLRKSDDVEKQEASELIPLARHIIRDILPNLLKQSPGLHFGRTRLASSPGKVVPFIGVDTPSNREFGYHYEALCKQFFTAGIKGIDFLQLEEFVKHFKNEAKKEALLKKCLFQETETATHFEKMTGFGLANVSSKTGLGSLFRKTQKDLALCMHIEAETALQVVTYYKHYHHSSAQSLPQLVHKLSGMTGTPWNKDGYSKKIGALQSDTGAEGQVLDTLLKRDHKTRVFSVDTPNMHSLLSNTENLPNVILDMGAMFKSQSNEIIAREFLEFSVNNKVSPKQGVVFFHCQVGDISSDRLALGRFIQGNWHVEILENSKEQAIIDKGVEVDQCLFFLDQRHTTGVDLPFPLNSHAITTVNENLHTRTLLQTVMRLRKFCYSQTTDFASTQSCYQFMQGQNHSLTVQGIVLYALAQEAQKKADSNLQSFKQQIDEVFIESFRRKVLAREIDPEVANAYQPFLCPQITDEPYRQFFCENALQDPMTYLRAYGDKKLEAFPQNIMKQEYTDIQKRIYQILKEVAAQKGIFSEWVVVSQAPDNNEVEAQVHQEIYIEQEAELSQELLQELQSYQVESPSRKAEHQRWWGDQDPIQDVKGFIDAIKTNTSHPSRFQSVSKNFKQGRYDSSRKFDLLFPENIFLTEAVQKSYKKHLSIFHPSQKIAESVLIIQDTDETYKFVIVSNEEAVFLGKNPVPKAWLVDSSGLPINNCDSSVDVLKNPKIRQNLVAINIFLGRASPIEDIPQGVCFFHMWLQNGGGTEKDRRDYVALRSYNQPDLDKLKHLDKLKPLTKSIQINTVIGQISRPKMGLEDVQKIQDPLEISLLPKNMIPYISCDQVPHINQDFFSLLTDPNKIQSVPVTKIKYLKDGQLQYLTETQVQHLSNMDIMLRISYRKWGCMTRSQRACFFASRACSVLAITAITMFVYRRYFKNYKNQGNCYQRGDLPPRKWTVMM